MGSMDQNAPGAIDIIAKPYKGLEDATHNAEFARAVVLDSSRELFSSGGVEEFYGGNLEPRRG